MDAALVTEVRAFNRAVSERIGALDDSFLGRGRPMAESRLLWEVGLDGCEMRQLRARLGLDSGYLTRVVASLREQGMISVRTSAADGRVRTLRLTPAGRRERATLDRLSDIVAWSVLEPLNARQRTRLVAAMSDVTRLLHASLVRFEIADPASPDGRWCIQHYFEELQQRFDAGFDPSRSISADDDELRPPHGHLLIARLRGLRIGCGALKLHAGAPAELKRMWVAPDARGIGVGSRLLRELEALALQSGARTIRLETNRALVEAIDLYRKSGYHEVAAFNDEPYAHHWFEKDLGHSGPS